MRTTPTDEAPPALQVLEIVGTGTYGTVCIAWDVRAQRALALKVVKEEHLADPRVLARARDEARMLALIDHPDVLSVYGVLPFGPRLVVALESVQGVSLRRLVHEHPAGIDGAAAAEIVRRCAVALYTAWETQAGPKLEPLHLVHRDVKPDNILVSVEGDVKVVDFGVARARFTDKESVTYSVVLGTRAYIAPERLDGRDAHPSGDVYALGCCLYELLGGRAHFASMSREEHTRQLAAQVDRLAITGGAAAAVEMLRALLRDMCAYRPDDRPTYPEIGARIGAVQDQWDRPGDLSAFAAEVVRPLYEARGWMPPNQHADWFKVAFVERGLPEGHLLDGELPAMATAGEVDRLLAKALADPRWPQRLDALRRIVAGNPGWNPAPLLAVLDAGSIPRWQVWRARAQLPEVLCALELLRRRRAAAVLRRFEAVSRHGEPLGAERARALLAASDARAVAPAGGL